MGCYQDEIFGPVLICINVNTLEEATAVVNENRHGNGCSIFTNSGAHARQFNPGVIRALDITLRFVCFLFGSAGVVVFRVLITTVPHNNSSGTFLSSFL